MSDQSASTLPSGKINFKLLLIFWCFEELKDKIMNKIMLTDSEFEEVKISSRSVEVSKELTETEVQEQLLYSVTKGCLRDLLRILSA